MSKHDDETKYSALSMLYDGNDFKSVATKLSIPLVTVIRWNKELKESVEQGGMNTLVNMDRVVLGKVIEQVVTDEPKLAGETAKLTDGLNYSTRLNSDLHIAALSLISRTKSFALSAETSGDLVLLADILCEVQKAFFNSNSTQVNVQNNYGESGGYEEFLTDVPAA